MSRIIFGASQLIRSKVALTAQETPIPSLLEARVLLKICVLDSLACLNALLLQRAIFVTKRVRRAHVVVSRNVALQLNALEQALDCLVALPRIVSFILKLRDLAQILQFQLL